MPDREKLLDHLQSSLERGSRSFALASRLFGRKLRARTTLLYAWCRACDDYIDGQHLGMYPESHVTANGCTAANAGERRIRELFTRCERVLRRTGTEPEELATDLRTFRSCDDLGIAFLALQSLVDECRLPEAYLRDHLEGFASDAAGHEPTSLQDLLRYCYRVAGVVGCLMALLMGIDPEDEETLDRASDLGIAFQLANIARDIGEDAMRGRCYVPREWLQQAGVARERLLAPENRGRIAELAARLVEVSLAYERSARSGAARLPFRARWAVLAATGIYGGIGREVARRGERALVQRVVIPRRFQLLCLAGALVQACGRAPLASRQGLWTRPRRSPA